MISQGSKQKQIVREGEAENEKKMGSQNENTACVHFAYFFTLGGYDVLRWSRAEPNSSILDELYLCTVREPSV